MFLPVFIHFLVTLLRALEAERRNFLFDLWTQSQVDDDTAVLQGLDGRKMSKSYNNTIPLFPETEKKFRK